jgi:hypothetical protein
MDLLAFQGMMGATSILAGVVTGSWTTFFALLFVTMLIVSILNPQVPCLTIRMV